MKRSSASSPPAGFARVFCILPVNLAGSRHVQSPLIGPSAPPRQTNFMPFSARNPFHVFLPNWSSTFSVSALSGDFFPSKTFNKSHGPVLYGILPPSRPCRHCHHGEGADTHIVAVMFVSNHHLAIYRNFPVLGFVIKWSPARRCFPDSRPLFRSQKFTLSLPERLLFPIPPLTVQTAAFF